MGECGDLEATVAAMEWKTDTGTLHVFDWFNHLKPGLLRCELA